MGGLLCWLGFHAERHEVRLAGLRVSCRRCGVRLLAVR